MALVTQTTMKAQPRGGLVPEDVLAGVWDISKIPLPFSDLCVKDTHKNNYCEWIRDALQSVNTANAVLDGADASGDQNALPTRVGNHSQISTKIVSASNRARDGDSFPPPVDDALPYQVMMRMRELYRDIEAISLLNQASRADNGTLAGNIGGFDAWLVTNTNNGASGANGGFQTGTGLVTAATPGTARALSEATLRDVIQSVYVQGGNPSVLMGRVPVIRRLSAYMFTSTAQIAQLRSDVVDKRSGAVATGSVAVFVTDFGIVLEIMANRLQQTTAANTSSLFIIDPSRVRQSFMAKPQMFDLAKVGLSDKKEMYADWTLKVLNEEAHGVFRAVNETLAMTA